MPDIREILQALDINDRALWSEQRTIMRRSYLNAHNQTVGIEDWKAEDDAFMDLIDIRLALLFDRAGRLNATHDIVGNGDKIAEDIKASEDKMKEAWSNSPYAKTDPAKIANFKNTDTIDEKAVSAASKLLQEGFASNPKEWSVK